VPIALYWQNLKPVVVVPHASEPVHFPVAQSVSVLHACRQTLPAHVYPAAHVDSELQAPDVAVPAGRHCGALVVPLQVAPHFCPVPHVAAPAAVMSVHALTQYFPIKACEHALNAPRHLDPEPQSPSAVQYR
jgi:hypothetical protein